MQPTDESSPEATAHQFVLVNPGPQGLLTVGERGSAAEAQTGLEDPLEKN